MSDAAREISVFICSPGDVRPERLRAEAVINRLSRTRFQDFNVKPYLWEREPLSADAPFQKLIRPPSQCDIVVAIVWSRLGSPLGKDPLTDAPLPPEVTGTTWELGNAWSPGSKAHQRTLLYVKKQDIVYPTDPTRTREQRDLLWDQMKQQEHLLEVFLAAELNNTDGTSRRAHHVFETTDVLDDLLEEHLGKILEEVIRAQGRVLVPARHTGTSPWPGLSAFSAEQKDLFFGRRRAINEVRLLLAARDEACAPCRVFGVAPRDDQRTFLMVLGASGSGKSSLVKAGLLPDLALPGMVPKVARCSVAVTRPGEGASPFAALAKALVDALPEMTSQHDAKVAFSERLTTLLTRSPIEVDVFVQEGLAKVRQQQKLEVVEDGKTKLLGEARVLLVVDQLEELFTGPLTHEQRRAYVTALDSLAKTGLVWVIATMRSDFMHQLESEPLLARLADQRTGRFQLLPPTPSEYAEIVTRPAREAGIEFQPVADDPKRRQQPLDRLIADEAANSPEALPLLSFLLDQLYQNRSGSMLTFAQYDALGGLKGAVSTRADAVLASLPSEVQGALPEVLRSLVTAGVSEGEPITAVSALRESFVPDTPADLLVDALEQHRLILSDPDAAGRRTVRVTHEALLTHWSKARSTLAAIHEDLKSRRLLSEEAAAWRADKSDRRDTLLLPRGLRLERAEDLLKRWSGDGQTELSRDFIEASREQLRREDEAARERERLDAQAERERLQADARRQRWISSTFATFSVVLVAVAWSAYSNQRRALRSENNAKLAAEAVTQAKAETDQRNKDLEAVNADLSKRTRELQEAVERERAARKSTSESNERLREAANKMLFELDGKLSGIPGTTEVRGQLADSATSYLAALEQAAEVDPTLNVSLFIAYQKLGVAESRLGREESALRNLQKAVEYGRTVAQDTPADSAARSNLAFTLRRLGASLNSLGRWTEAESAFRDAVAIGQTGYALKHDPDWATELSRVHMDYGSALAGVGRYRDSVAQADAAVATARSAAEAAKTPSSQINLATALRVQALAGARIGDTMQWIGPMRESLSIAEAALSITPDDANAQEAVALTSRTMGSAYASINRWNEALPPLQRSVEIRRRQVSADPANANLMIDLAFGLWSVADVLPKSGKLQEEVDANVEAMQLFRTFAYKDPAVPGRHGDLFRAYYRVASSFMRIAKDAAPELNVDKELCYSRALKYYAAAKVVMERVPERQRKKVIDPALAQGVQQALDELDGLLRAVSVDPASIEMMTPTEVGPNFPAPSPQLQNLPAPQQASTDSSPPPPR